MLSPYQKGYDDAVADLATIAYFFWTFWLLGKERVLQNRPLWLKMLGWLSSVVAFYFLFSYVLVPVVRFVSGMFASD